MTRMNKRIFCLALAIILVIACASPAFADNELKALSPADKQRFGAWVASALMAGQIFVESIVAPVANLYNYLSDPYDVEYSYSDTYYQDWMDKNKIVIDENHVQIEGTWYDNVWLSHDAAEKFRTNAFDLQTAYNIASNSNGILAEGIGYYDGVPIFDDGTYIQSQYFGFSATGVYQIGNGNFTAYSDHSGSYVPSYSVGGYGVINRNNNPPFNFIIRKRGNSFNAGIIDNNGEVGWSAALDNRVFDNSPFDFNWVSKVIDLDPLSSNEGLSILVPHEEMEPFYNNHPDFDPQVNPDINIDVDSPDFPDAWDMVDDLIDIITTVLKLLPDGAVKFESEPEPAPQPPDPDPDPYPDPEPVPYPDPDPEPGTSLPDIDWTDLFNTIKNIYNAISQGNVISQTIANIANEIKNLTDNIKWQIEQLRNQLGDIVDKIIHGNKDWFNDIVDSIKTPFIPWINAFKSGVGIWHYVVEWITYIENVFSFFFNVMRDINYYLVLPIYALIAGTIVIAIYRRFGR